jgi:energy-converting hydrogenase Eha subunit E
MASEHEVESHLVVRRYPRLAQRFGAITLWVGWFVCMTALLLIVLVEVESVLVTGPILMTLGIAATVLGGVLRYWRMSLLGLAYIGVCLLFFGLVVSLGWGPRESKIPFVAMGTLFTIASLPFVVWVARYVPRRTDPWRCKECGYLLYGLTDPRCPECGTPFDPGLLDMSPAND